ncbi:MAG: hypothetical protein AB2L14_04200 [Candidatus Xenobiia bacterium LiM19]
MNGRTIARLIISPFLLLAFLLLISGCGGGSGGGSGQTSLTAAQTGNGTGPDSSAVASGKTGTFTVTVQLPKSAKSRKVNGKVIPYGYKSLKVNIQGEATTKADTSTITLDGNNKYQKTISDVPVGLNVATIQILDASNSVLAQRTHGFYMTAGGTATTGSLPMGVAVTATGACDPQNIDIPAGTTLVFENLDTANNRTVLMNDGAVTIGPIDKVTAASGETTPATYNYASHTFSTAGTYTYDDGLGAPGRVLVYSSSTVSRIVDSDENDYDTKTASSTVTFTLTGTGFGANQAAVSGKVEFKNVDAAGTVEATVSTWNDTTITGSIDIPQGTYRVIVTADGRESVGKVIYYKGYDWRLKPECQTNIPSVGQAEYTSLAIYNDNGTPVPYIAYMDYGNSSKATVKKFNGTTWETIGTAGFSAGQALWLSLAIYNDNGTPVPYVAYRDTGKSFKATVMKYNGTTWETVGTAGFSDGEALFTSLVVYGDNGTPVPYIAYKDEGNSGKATVKKFNGTTWETIGTAGFSAETAFYTSLAVYDNVGTPVPYVAYEDNGNSSKATVKKFNGATWETVGTAGFSAKIAEYTSLAIYDNAGTPVPYVAYKDNGNSGKATVKKFNGATWETVGTAGFSAGTTYYTSLAVYDNAGTPVPYVTYRDGGNSSKAMVMKYNTTTWETVGTAGFSAGTAYYTSLAVYDNAGTPVPYVAYIDYGYDSRSTVKKYNGNSWETVGADNEGLSTGQAYYTSLAVYDNAGTPVPYVAYQDAGNSSKATVKEYNGTSWETVGTAGFSTGTAEYISLAIYDNAGTPVPYVTYKDSGSSGKATVKKYNGTAWETVGTAGFSTGQADSISLVVYNDNGTPVPYVAYLDDGNSGKATVMKYNGATWETVGTAGFSAENVAYTSLAIYDNAGTPVPYIAYKDYGNIGKATVMKYNGTAWETVGTAGFSAGTVNYNSLAIYDNGGTPVPYVAYGDGYHNDKATVMKYNGTAWETVGTAGFSAGKVNYNSLAIYDNAGTPVPYVAYKDYGNSTKATVMKFNGSTWTSLGQASPIGADYVSLAIYNKSGIPIPYVAFSCPAFLSIFSTP